MDWYRFGAVCALAAIALGIWVSVDPAALTDQALAAWVQAFGSILAIAGAVFAARYQAGLTAAVARREKILEAQGMATLLSPLAANLMGRIDVARNGRFLDEHKVVIPEEITRRLERLWIMGGAGGNLLQTVAALNESNDLLVRTDNGRQLPINEYVPAYKRNLTTLDIAFEACEEAVRQMMALIDYQHPV